MVNMTHFVKCSSLSPFTSYISLQIDQEILIWMLLMLNVCVRLDHNKHMGWGQQKGTKIHVFWVSSQQANKSNVQADWSHCSFSIQPAQFWGMYIAVSTLIKLGEGQPDTGRTQKLAAYILINLQFILAEGTSKWWMLKTTGPLIKMTT